MTDKTSYRIDTLVSAGKRWINQQGSDGTTTARALDFIERFAAGRSSLLTQEDLAELIARGHAQLEHAYENNRSGPAVDGLKLALDAFSHVTEEQIGTRLDQTDLHAAREAHYSAAGIFNKRRFSTAPQASTHGQESSAEPAERTKPLTGIGRDQLYRDYPSIPQETRRIWAHVSDACRQNENIFQDVALGSGLTIRAGRAMVTRSVRPYCIEQESYETVLKPYLDEVVKNPAASLTHVATANSRTDYFTLSQVPMDPWVKNIVETAVASAYRRARANGAEKRPDGGFDVNVFGTMFTVRKLPGYSLHNDSREALDAWCHELTAMAPQERETYSRFIANTLDVKLSHPGQRTPLREPDFNHPHVKTSFRPQPSTRGGR